MIWTVQMTVTAMLGTYDMDSADDCDSYAGHI